MAASTFGHTCPITSNRALQGKARPLEQPQRLGLLLVFLSLHLTSRIQGVFVETKPVRDEAFRG